MKPPSERSLLLDAIVLYESTKQHLPADQRYTWERWKTLALELLYEQQKNPQ